MDFAIKAPPLRRVLVFGVNILEGNWEVHQEQIKVLDAPQLELVLGDLLGLLTSETVDKFELGWFLRGASRGKCSRV